MNINRNISSTQITWLVGMVLGLCLAVVIGSAVGSEDIRTVGLILGAFICIGTFLALGKHYWLLVPFSLGAQFPAVPLGGRAIEFPELCIAGCFVFFLLRVASRKEQFHVFRSVSVPFLVFMAWVGMVFALNPIGLAMLGSSIGGGRFYLKIGLAFVSFFILSNRTYSEKDLRWVVGILIFGACFGAVYGFAEYAFRGPPVNPATGMVDEGYYTWHQVLSWPAFTIAFLIFARWSPKEVFGFQRLGVLAAYFACIAVVLLSGKRMGLIAVLMAPMVSAVMYRQYAHILVAFSILFLSLSAMVAGQGQLFTLPMVAQRTLSWLPGDWDPEMERYRGGTDEWRAQLRRFAIQNIKQDPWIGRGFAVDLGETITAIGMESSDGSIDAQTAAYALGRSWHNVWLGYAADFGIPFSLMQAAVLITVLVLSKRIFYEYGGSSAFGYFALYLFIFTMRDVVASWTGGHSALDAFQRWWMYGIIVALYLQNRGTSTRSRSLHVDHSAPSRIPAPQKVF